MRNRISAQLAQSAAGRLLRALLAAALAGLALAACAGYGPQGRETLSLPEDRRDLCIVSVDNPTLRPSLSSQLRNLLRDELSKRGQIRWTSREKATAIVHLRVQDFSSQTTLAGSHDETLKSTASITVEAWIERRPEGGLLWKPHTVSIARSYTANDRSDAEDQVLEQAAQRLADLMNQAY